MFWLFVALSGTLLYVAVMYIDKYVVEIKVDDPIVFGIISGLVSLAVAVLGISVFGLNGIPISAFFILLGAGILMGVANFLYFYALSKINVSNVAFLFQFVPVFVLIFAFVLLGETIGFVQLLGFSLALISVFGVVLVDHTKDAVFDKFAVFLIILYDIFYALAGVMIRSTAEHVKFGQLVMLEATGYAIVTCTLLLFSSKIRISLVKMVKKLRFWSGFIIVGNEGILFLGAKSAMNFAYTLAPAALVSIVESTQAVFTLFTGLLLTLLFPKVFQENTKPSALFKKIILSVFVVIGLVLTQP